jgi:AcrR family transcriptional regulator
VSATTATPRRQRATQAQRRAETKAALLDATIECLVAHGYARTTTGRIAELAGVSRGAQLPYFRSRDDIVAAAVAHLAEKRIAAFTVRVGDGPVSLEDCLDALWEEHQGPVFAAALELWVASRTDPELRTRMLRIERDVAAAVARIAESAVGETALRPGFAEDLIHVLATIRGLALLQVSNGSSSRTLSELWRQSRERLLEVLA